MIASDSTRRGDAMKSEAAIDAGCGTLWDHYTRMAARFWADFTDEGSPCCWCRWNECMSAPHRLKGARNIGHDSLACGRRTAAQAKLDEKLTRREHFGTVGSVANARCHRGKHSDNIRAGVRIPRSNEAPLVGRGGVAERREKQKDREPH